MITVPKLLILLVIIIVIFGTRRLRDIGSDLGGAIKSFKTALKDGEEDGKKPEVEPIEADTLTKKNDEV